MATATLNHRYTPSRCNAADQHAHGYNPPGWAVQRCGCNSRTFTITVGRHIDPEVKCHNCGRPNRTATAYERGRADEARNR